MLSTFMTIYIYCITNIINNLIKIYEQKNLNIHSHIKFGFNTCKFHNFVLKINKHYFQ